MPPPLDIAADAAAGAAMPLHWLSAMPQDSATRHAIDMICHTLAHTPCCCRHDFYATTRCCRLALPLLLMPLLWPNEGFAAPLMLPCCYAA